MRAQFTARVGGERVTFSMPIGAIERVSAYEPHPFRLYERLAAGKNDVRLMNHHDVRAVLDAACGEETAGRVIEAGWVPAAAYAMQILALALSDDDPEAKPGKVEAALKSIRSLPARISSWAGRWGGRPSRSGRQA